MRYLSSLSQYPISTTCVHTYTCPAEIPSHEVNTSLCLCSGQEKSPLKNEHKILQNNQLIAACASLPGSGCCWLATIRANAWVMPAERWWIWADPSPLPGCPVPPVTNGKHLWDSWQGEGWRRGHDPSSPASAQIKGSLAFSSYQINLLAPMICIALNLPTAVKSVKHAGIGFGFWHFSMQSLHYVYYTYSYSRAVGLFLCVCKDNFKKIIFQSSEILSGLYIWCLGQKKMEENGLTSHIWRQTAQEGTSESVERYTRLGNCR